MTHGHELRWWNDGGRGFRGCRGIKGRKKWDDCNIFKNIFFKKTYNPVHVTKWSRSDPSYFGDRSYYAQCDRTACAKCAYCLTGSARCWITGIRKQTRSCPHGAYSLGQCRLLCGLWASTTPRTTSHHTATGQVIVAATGHCCTTQRVVKWIHLASLDDSQSCIMNLTWCDQRPGHGQEDRYRLWQTGNLK